MPVLALAVHMMPCAGAYRSLLSTAQRKTPLPLCPTLKPVPLWDAQTCLRVALSDDHQHHHQLREVSRMPQDGVLHRALQPEHSLASRT